MAALGRAAGRHRREIEALAPLARELARQAGPGGILVADVRLAAMQRGLLPGGSQGRALSYLGAVMRAAGLKRNGDWRRSFLALSHGNLQAVWVLP